MSDRAGGPEPRHADEPWTRRDLRDGFLIAATTVLGILLVFAVAAAIGFVTLLIFGFDIPNQRRTSKCVTQRCGDDA